MKRNIKDIYFYYTFNRANLIILGVSILFMIGIFNAYDFNISAFDYMVLKEEYHIEYLEYALNIAIPIYLIVIMLIMSIDYMMNRKRFDLMFASKFSRKDIMMAKYIVYISLTIVYVTILWLEIMLVGILRFKEFYLTSDYARLYFSLIIQGVVATSIIFIIMRVTRMGYSSIIIVLMYFISKIISDSNAIIGSILFINIDIRRGVIPIGLVPGAMIYFIYFMLIYFFIPKLEIK